MEAKFRIIDKEMKNEGSTTNLISDGEVLGFDSRKASQRG